MMREIIYKLENKQCLTYYEVADLMEALFTSETDDAEIVKFLDLLTEKGETDEELLGMLDKLKEHAMHVPLHNNESLIDVCGTGGDKLQTFNISTTASFVIASCGGNVAKHGNRSVSSVSGSADIFEFFGYDLFSEPQEIPNMIEKFGISFMFAPKYHPAMKKVASARKKLGKRTAFNLLGPLSNPADVKNQLIGVSSSDFLERIPNLLQKREFQNVMTVMSFDGMDEFSTAGKNKVCYLHNGTMTSQIVDPQELGLSKSSISDIGVSTKKEAILAFVSVLNGTAKRAMIETTALNAAAGLIVAEKCSSFQEGIDIAMHSIKSGLAYNLFQNFLKSFGDVSKLEEVDELLKTC